MYIQVPNAQKTICLPKTRSQGKICEETLWRVNRAMYGLVTSPRSWSTYRDTTMWSMRGTHRGKDVRFRQSRADDSLWYILLLPVEEDGEAGGDEADTVQGLLIVYVDDILIAAAAVLARTVSQMFRSQWRCSDPEWASVTGCVKFNGFEVRAVEDRLELHQDSYVTDLLARRQDIVGVDDVPAPLATKFANTAPWEGQEDGFDKVKEAQAIAGELSYNGFAGAVGLS